MTAPAVLADILAERTRQDEKWGQQDHPSGAAGHFFSTAEWMRLICDQAAADGVLTWLDIAEEEFWEAFSETDPTKRRVELVQLAAVIVACIESEDRRAAAQAAEAPCK